MFYKKRLQNCLLYVERMDCPVYIDGSTIPVGLPHFLFPARSGNYFQFTAVKKRLREFFLLYIYSTVNGAGDNIHSQYPVQRDGPQPPLYNSVSYFLGKNPKYLKNESL